MVIVTKMLKQMFLYVCFLLRMFSAIRLITIPPRSKTVHYLLHVLFVALITCKEIDQAFVNKTKLMAYSISFSGKSAIKGVCLINICTYLTTCAVIFTQSY